MSVVPGEDSLTSSPAVTIGEWLARAQPSPPAPLAGRLAQLVEADAARSTDDLPEVLLHAGEELLQRLLLSGSTTRESALDLLCVDALVTYAFEAAAGNPDRMEERAVAAMRRIAALARA